MRTTKNCTVLRTSKITPLPRSLGDQITDDVRLLSDEILSEDELKAVYVGLTEPDILIGLWDDVFAKIEFWPENVSAFRKHLLRRR